MLDNKSILFVISSSDVGGAGKMIKLLANSVCHHFRHTTLLELYSPVRGKEIDDAINVIPLGIKMDGKLSFRLRAIRLIRSQIKSIKPDIVVTFVSHECMLTRFATIGLKTKVCSCEREDPYTFPWIDKILFSIAYRLSDYAFFQLPKARDFYGKSLLRKSFVIPNVFIPPKGFNPFNGERKKTIVSAGRFVEQKGYDMLINAFAIVHKSHPEYSLVLYGEGPLENSYKIQSSKLGIKDSLYLPGYVKDVASAIREDGIFVLSSIFEGIPNSLIEAMSTGIPCVATDCSPGGPRYLSDNGKRLILVPMNDCKKIAESICYLIENPEYADKLGDSGRYVLELLEPQKILGMWLTAFENILGNKKSEI